MYAKVFASMLDSSIWLESVATRVVWVTLLASKDGDGYAHFAALENLARRANVTLEEARTAVATLESPDDDSTNKSYGGRRIERVPGGWMILNAAYYDDLARREQERASNRERVQRYRDRAKPQNDATRDPSANIEHRERTSQQAERHAQPPQQALDLDSDDSHDSETNDANVSKRDVGYPADFLDAWHAYPRRPGNNKRTAYRQWQARVREGVTPQAMIDGVQRYAAYCEREQKQGEHIKMTATFLGRDRHFELDYAPDPLDGRRRPQSQRERNDDVLDRVISTDAADNAGDADDADYEIVDDMRDASHTTGPTDGK
jgi:hypothetical protein